MEAKNISIQPFINGATWLRADFHLHTDADSEFTHSGDQNFYYSNYIEKLWEQDIRIAAITNHNKFDLEEYKSLEKTAKNKGIYLLPGIELSVADGATGIHTLVIFNPEKWLENGTNFINQFLASTFAGKANFENENGRSNDNLLDTIKKLDAFNRDYFMVMAHIEDRCGFIAELKGGRIEEIGNDPLFQKSVLAFQKVRTRDKINNLKQWINGKLPAFVEGSDPKSIDEIGKGNKTFLKLGDFNFDALKFALIDYENRVKTEPEIPTNGYVKSVSITGSKFEGTVHLNHAMNNLIGIRGSGKSSILEALRYVLDIDLDEKHNEDVKYKTDIVGKLIGSGGKVRCVLVDENKNEFVAEKTWGDARASLYQNGELQRGLRTDAIVKKPIYYGQKDLSKIGDSKTTEFLIGKLTGNSLEGKKREIDDTNQEIIRLINEIEAINNKLKRKPDYEANKAELELKIQKFKDNKLEEKLGKQIDFNNDLNFLNKIENFETEVIEALEKFIQEFQDRFAAYKIYVSKQSNPEILEAIQALTSYEIVFSKLAQIQTELTSQNQGFHSVKTSFEEKFNALKEAFSEEKRKLGLSDIQADDYLKYNKDFEIAKAQLSELEKLSNQKALLDGKLHEALKKLQQLWKDEYEIISKEVEQVNSNQPEVKIDGKTEKTIEVKVGFKANKTEFKEYLKNYLKGANLRESNFQTIVEEYDDMIAFWIDLASWPEKQKITFTDNQLYAIRESYRVNLSAFLTYRIPDKYEIIYRGRPLHEHSLGQRASALIIFLLTLKDSDLIIIDQPEDDLDNQTIYNDVIKVLKKLKNNTQFIFATHNPNIPVLGDCEQVVQCSYESERFNISSGSIDCVSTREAIVGIMEGGKEAFNNRKKIYELWMH